MGQLMAEVIFLNIAGPHSSAGSKQPGKTGKLLVLGLSLWRLVRGDRLRYRLCIRAFTFIWLRSTPLAGVSW